jgi:hypothetical protein
LKFTLNFIISVSKPTREQITASDRYESNEEVVEEVVEEEVVIDMEPEKSVEYPEVPLEATETDVPTTQIQTEEGGESRVVEAAEESRGDMDVGQEESHSGENMYHCYFC